MIIVRLALHIKNIRSALGFSAGATGLYMAIITMVVESSALYAMSGALFMGTFASSSSFSFVFSVVFSHCQVRGYFSLVSCNHLMLCLNH